MEEKLKKINLSAGNIANVQTYRKQILGYFGVKEIQEPLAVNSELIKKYQFQNTTEAEVLGLFAPTAVPDISSKRYCLGHFIQDQIKIANEIARKVNNAISPVFSRGKLLFYIVAAETIRGEMYENPDYHNPAPRELSKCFDSQVDEKGLVTIDLAKHGVHVANNEELALNLILLDRIHSIDEGHDKKIANRSIDWRDWYWQSIPRSLMRFFAGTVGFLGDILISIPAGIFKYDLDSKGYPSEWLEKFLLSFIPDPREKKYSEE